MKNVLCYVDGFNLYFSLRRKFKKLGCERKYIWFDIKNYLVKILRPDEQLVGVKYFTSIPTVNASKELRHRTYVAALESTGISVIYGYFFNEIRECKKPKNIAPYCDHKFSIPKEKLTDVNIACEMLVDAYKNNYKRAYLLGGDTDLAPAIRKVKHVFKNPNKDVFLIFPDKRNKVLMNEVGNKCITMKNTDIANSQFPNTIILPDGTKIHKPKTWV